jgi:hypothetical protein
MKNKIDIEYIDDTKLIRHQFQITYFDQPFTIYVFTKENGEIHEFKMYDENDVEDNDMVVYNYFANNLEKLMSAKNNFTTAKI